VLILSLTVIALLAALVLGSYVVESRLGAEVVKIAHSGEPLIFSDLAAGPKPAGTVDDAADYYGRALSGMTADDLEKLVRTNASYRMKISTAGTGDFSAELREELASALVPFRTVLEGLDRGADMDLFGPVISVEQGIEVCGDRLRSARMAAILLSTRTLKLIVDGEDDAAVNSVISMMRMARIFDHQPIIVVHTVKIGVVDLACEDIYLVLKVARPSEQSLARLQKALSETIPASALEKMFLTERVYQTEVARNLLPENIVSQYLQKDVPDLPERLRLPERFWVRFRIRQKAVQYLRDMSRLIAAVRRPWPEPLDVMAGGLPEPAKGRLITSGAAFIRLTSETLVAVRCAVLAIAVERYRRSHGELPRSLDDVAGAYIDSIPLDPFTGERILYGRDEEGYVVYSVGHNRQDDGGSVRLRAGEKSPQDLGLRL
jgi:hypothetical protein